ncbi:MAG: ribosomal protein small subunit ribosomal protein [Candidatus Berkelbacteria bacterium]|nr:ribosomal protein small subunit ribosomal protein [Candidatus Berkelbacteria bacterium]
MAETKGVPKKTIKTIKDIFTAIGRRKTAIARVKLVLGSGKITINDKEIANPSRIYTEPLKITGYDKKVDCFVKVSGGGLVSQEGAIKLGVARALEKIQPDLHKTLKVEGFLTRDPRMKERKKPGLKGARRAPQWQKR